MEDKILKVMEKHYNYQRNLETLCRCHDINKQILYSNLRDSETIFLNDLQNLFDFYTNEYEEIDEEEIKKWFVKAVLYLEV